MFKNKKVERSFILKISLFFFMGIIVFSCKPKAQVFDLSKLQISVVAITNSYQGKNQGLAKLIILNNATKKFPANGWRIFFNSKNGIIIPQIKAPFTLDQSNGNLFQLTPKESFKGIAAGENVAMEVVFDGQFLNKNDQPEGFYLVWDTEPMKGINLKNLTTIPLPIQAVDGAISSDFASKVYYKNIDIEKLPAENTIKVFPTPVSYQANASSFLLNYKVQINTDALFDKEAKILAEDLFVLLGTKIMFSQTANNDRTISLIKELSIAAEGYELTVNAKGVFIAASTPTGIFYGIQSLKSLLPVSAWNKAVNEKSIEVPGVTITDAPRFGYRGFMLDVARNFQTKKEILRVLDLMALYKLNTFHFHLTDDEGWRIEINGLPELTDIGAKRGHTLDEKTNMPAAYGSGAVTGSLYGSGFYSKTDFIEILRYATARHIKVIPEIETPGHARAAIKAMDARYQRLLELGKKDDALQYFLRDVKDESVYTTAQSLHDNVMDVALPSTYNFIEKVVTEIVNLYTEADAPLTTIHLGGDEVPAGVWEKSPDHIALIKNNPLIKDVDGIWYYYISKVNDILKAKGLSLSGWEEIAFKKTVDEGKKIVIPNSDFVKEDMKLYVWNNLQGSEDLAYKMANAGYKVVLTFVTNFYFDMAQYKTYDEPGYYWGGYTDLEKTYRFIPFDYLKNVKIGLNGKPVDQAYLDSKIKLTESGKANIIGLQGSMWSETIKGPQQMEYMILPRLTALAENAWAKNPEWATETDTSKATALFNKAWAQYNHQLGWRELPRLDTYAGGFNYRIPFAGAIVKEGKVYANVQFPNLTIRYTTNGQAPTPHSAIYSEPIGTKGIIKLKVFNKMGRSGNITEIENK